MHISGKRIFCGNKNAYFVATLNSFYNTLLQLKTKCVNLPKQLKRFFKIAKLSLNSKILLRISYFDNVFLRYCFLLI